MVEGVYFGGQLSSAQKADPATVVREYRGFASWFTGQLDGEVLNNDWTYRNDVTAREVFASP